MRWLFWWRPPCLYRQVIVNLRNESTSALQGVLWSQRGAWLTFRRVTLLRTGESPTPVDGDVVIERGNVLFLQVLP